MSFSWIWIAAFSAVAAGQSHADLREAARLDRAGRCEEAEVIYQRALAQGKPTPALLNNTGNHYLACGKPGKARVYFEQLLRIDASHLNANVQLARMAMREGRFSQAEEMLQKIAASKPGDFEILFLLGQSAARAGNVTRARDALEAALKLRPDSVDAMLEAGLANAASGDLPRAVFLLARAHSRAPDNAPIALALARASEDAGYYGDAVLAYDRYLALHSSDGAARRDRARVLALTANGRHQGARELEAWTAKHPEDALGHFYLAQICWSDEPERALASLAEAVRIDPRLTSAHVARAWLLHRMGRDAEALPHLNAALRESPTHVRALDQMGLVMLGLDRAAEAEAVLRKAAAIAPDDADVALHLGRVLIDNGKEDEGQRHLDRWQKLRPARQRHARADSGMIELATLNPAARRAREIERFRSMARARPDDAVLQLHLAELLLDAGHTEEAMDEFDRLSSMNAEAAVWAAAGRALLRAGRHEAAQPFLQRAGTRLEAAEALLLAKRTDAALSTLEDMPPQDRSAEYKLLLARVLDAAGRADDSLEALQSALQGAPLGPVAARQASLLLAKHGRYQESLDLLAQALQRAPADRELRLTEAVLLALSGQTATATERLRRIQFSWPEWHEPWLAHGFLLMEMRQSQEAAAKFRAAAALGASDRASSCASLRAWVFGACGD